ncbi:hypothetical protein GMSM_46180 [Geomonas sp. Red276]
MADITGLDLSELLDFDKEMERFAKEPLWSVRDFLQVMVTTRLDDLFNDDASDEDDNDVERIIEATYREYLETFKTAGPAQPPLVERRVQEEPPSYLPWQFGLIYNVKTFLSSAVGEPLRKLNKDSRLLAKHISPTDAIAFADSQGWPIHPRLILLLSPSEPATAEPVTAEPTRSKPDTDEPKRGVAGAESRWAKRDSLVKCAETLMKEMLKIGCLCNHEKLATIAYELGTNDDGVVLKDCDQKRSGLRGAIKKMAKSLVPEERQFGNDKYTPDACLCKIADHQKFKMSRHRQ